MCKIMNQLLTIIKIIFYIFTFYESLNLNFVLSYKISYYTLDLVY
jgi:hypothetical protein